jgi:hypothetical protein
MQTTKRDFLDVSGVGQVKLAKYGDMFLEVIDKFGLSDGIDFDEERELTVETVKELRRLIEATFQYSDEAVSISAFIGKVNNMLFDNHIKRVSEWEITNRLAEDGYIEPFKAGGLTCHTSTDKGSGVGIEGVKKVWPLGWEDYFIFLGIDAQRFLLKRVLDDIERRVRNCSLE